MMGLEYRPKAKRVADEYLEAVRDRLRASRSVDPEEFLDGLRGHMEKELAEANNLLVEMDKNLDNWRKDVLGFREEMRQADAAQIEALQKILSLLGAEQSAEEPEGEQE